MKNDLMESLKTFAKEAREKDFFRWKETILKHASEPKSLQSGLIIDIAVCPIFWFRQTQEVLGGSLGKANDFEGLPYSLFLLASEWFLKGLWILRKHSKWISLDTSVSPEERLDLVQELRGLTEGKNHDLEKMIHKIKPLFIDDEITAEFLDVLDGIIHQHYWPYYRGGEDWVACRYPTWIYDEATNRPKSFKSESMLRKVDVCELFKRIHEHLRCRYIESVVLLSRAQVINEKAKSLKDHKA